MWDFSYLAKSALFSHPPKSKSAEPEKHVLDAESAPIQMHDANQDGPFHDDHGAPMIMCHSWPPITKNEATANLAESWGSNLSPAEKQHLLKTYNLSYHSRLRLSTTNGLRIAIVGAGHIGAAAANALIMNSVAGESLVSPPEYFDPAVMIRCLTARPLGSSFVWSVIQAMRPFRADAILLVVSNPVDSLTTLAQQLSGLPASQVLGSGLFLTRCGCAGSLPGELGSPRTADSVDIYVLGVQGLEEVVAWSTAALTNECKLISQATIQAKGQCHLALAL
ncbi:hypothetical protein CNMCM5793_004610 [Aspergillus hiratsukae]|uniref:Uncharacterized protein n=1 Tax=Aspergillus hiratsukae TaxID=1194566 RepID=A0A8H6UHX5_9EURO|nr:hypothetical protein CNMCM5793_004610 [Aspergillus hiratsukae]KAF7170078.1 hypothetical protein CNMCM6106_004901 [Aspergillus hiratsukae]